jgi:hypothetical protein
MLLITEHGIITVTGAITTMSGIMANGTDAANRRLAT